MRAWPVSDRAWPCESSSRAASVTSDVASAAAPKPVERQRCAAPCPSNCGLPDGVYGSMTLRTADSRACFEQEDLNFLLTNRIPRRLLTRFMGWFSKIEQPLVRDLSIGIWRLFADLDLGEARRVAVSQPARLLHPRAQGAARARSTPIRRPGQPVRRDRRRLRRDRRHRALPGQGFSLHARRPARRPRRWSTLTATAAT